MQFTIQANGKKNVTILRVGRMEFLFSYQTFVAWESEHGECFKTAEKFSVTTSRHVTQWLDGRKCVTVPEKVWEDWREVFISKFIGTMESSPHSFYNGEFIQAK